MEDDEIPMFEDAVSRFLDIHAPPQEIARWRHAGVIDRDLWFKAGEAGLLCPSVPEAYGGAGGNIGHETVIVRQLVKHGLDGWGVPMHNGIVAHYILDCGTEAQRRRWLPAMATGELSGAIAMTEPGTGSDLRAIRTAAKRDGDHFVISGSKTFITNGQTANLIIVVAKTDTSSTNNGLSLIVVETDVAEGFRRGRNLDKIGLELGDTSELFFDEVRVPVANLLGEVEAQGLPQLMQQLPRERLLVALECVEIMERALHETVVYTRERSAFGKPIIEFQNTAFKLAEAKTLTTIARVFVERCSEQLRKGELDATTASMAKLWTSDTAQRVVDECLQLHGGYGYMNEYPIAQMYKDIRVKRIYGGTNEIMKLLIARSL